MTYIQKKRKGKGNSFKYVILFLFILFFVLNYFKITPFNKITLSVSGPALVIKEKALSPFDNFFSYFKSKKDLEEQNENLQREISDLKIEVLSSEILRYEYQSLSKQKENSDEEVEIAKVILKPPFSSFDSLVLSGDFDSSKIGQKVFYRNIIVGEIIEVGGGVATVKLASASGTKSPAKLKDGSQFEIIGRGNGMYEMTLPRDAQIESGDPIAFPDGAIVLYGFVNEILATDDDLFIRVLFNTPVDFRDLNYLRIGKPLSVLE